MGVTTTIDTDAPDYLTDGVLTDVEAWVPITTSVCTSGGITSITWSSSTGKNNWSQYLDLVIIGSSNDIGAAANGCVVEFNGSTSGYMGQTLYGSGASASAYADTDLWLLWHQRSATEADRFSCGIGRAYDINSGKWKYWSTVCGDDRDGSGYAFLEHGRYASQDPITSIQLDSNASSGGFAEHSRFDLFGILPRMVS